MTDDDELVADLTIRIQNDDNKGGYIKLEDCELDEPLSEAARCSVCYWVKLAIFVSCLGFLAAAFIIWVGPFFMDKVVYSVFSIYCLHVFYLFDRTVL